MDVGIFGKPSATIFSGGAIVASWARVETALASNAASNSVGGFLIKSSFVTLDYTFIHRKRLDTQAKPQASSRHDAC